MDVLLSYSWNVLELALLSEMRQVVKENKEKALPDDASEMQLKLI